MKIDSIDFFYLSMPQVTLDADGSQDALLVRVEADGHLGWGECEASPLTSIAAFVTPRSHGACQPVADSVLGQQLNDPTDIVRISRLVERNSMDLLQAPHTFSGIEMALWDLLGKVREEPVWKLLGYRRSEPKSPYASLLFGETQEETLRLAREAVAHGFRAAKFGWGEFGTGGVQDDVAHLIAAREGLGDETELFIDAGQVWGDDIEAAAARIPALEAAGATWLEEPFHASAYREYAELARRSRSVRLAGGEGSHNPHMALNLMDFGGVGIIQIDCGRIGGIAAAKRVADAAVERGVAYINHTFTSHLALSASLQPYAGVESSRICEYPAEPRSLAFEMTTEHLLPDDNGQIAAPDRPGLGMSIDLQRLRPYQRSVSIVVDDQTLFSSSPDRMWNDD